MSLFKREQWRLDVGPERLILSQRQAPIQHWIVARSLPVSATGHQLDLGPALTDVLHPLDGRNTDLQIVMDNRLARFFMVTPPPNLFWLNDLKAICEFRFHTLFSQPASGWRIEGAWHAREAFMACALPRSLIDAARLAAIRFKARITALQPEFLTAWDACLPAINEAQSWFVYDCDTHAMIAAADNGHIRWISLWLPSISNAKDAMLDYVAREAIKSGRHEVARIYVTGPDTREWHVTGSHAPGITPLPDHLWKVHTEAPHLHDTSAH